MRVSGGSPPLFLIVGGPIWLLKTLRILILLATLAGLPATVRAQIGGGVPEPAVAAGLVERLDPRINEVISPEARVVRIAQGFQWSEGPVWDVNARCLLFSDVPQNTVFRWRGGVVAGTFLKPSGYTIGADRGGETGSNGLTFSPDGDLVLMQHGDRRIARLGKDKQFLTLVDRYEGKRFNSPNDGVFSRRGDLYFTDPPYGLPKGVNDPTRELDFQGVYRLAKNSQLTLITKELSFPNGIALSPDEKTLYVANSDPQKAIWMAYPLGEDGGLSGPGRVFFDATPWVGSRPGLPDGMKVDKQGNLFASGPGGILIFDPHAHHLGTIATGEPTANCAWGDDGSMLYITANHAVLRIPTLTGITLPKPSEPEPKVLR